MTEGAARSICAILGLGLGLAVMVAAGVQGMIAGAVFGAGGAVLGGITGEKLYAWLQQRRDDQ